MSSSESGSDFSGGSSSLYNPSSSSDSSRSIVAENVKRRKIVNTSSWTRNIAKKKLACGKSHTNTTGKNVGPRCSGGDCKCKNKCYDKVSPKKRDKILKKFNKIGYKYRQDCYLTGLIKTKDINCQRSKTGTGTSRKVAHEYNVSKLIFYEWLFEFILFLLASTWTF